MFFYTQDAKGDVAEPPTLEAWSSVLLDTGSLGPGGDYVSRRRQQVWLSVTQPSDRMVCSGLNEGG